MSSDRALGDDERAALLRAGGALVGGVEAAWALCSALPRGDDRNARGTLPVDLANRIDAARAWLAGIVAPQTDGPRWGLTGDHYTVLAYLAGRPRDSMKLHELQSAKGLPIHSRTLLSKLLRELETLRLLDRPRERKGWQINRDGIEVLREFDPTR